MNEPLTSKDDLLRLLQGAHIELCSGIQTEPVQGARLKLATAINLLERSSTPETTAVRHGPLAVYTDHLKNRVSSLPGCDCSACEDRRAAEKADEPLCSCGHDGPVGPGHQGNCPQYRERAENGAEQL